MAQPVQLILNGRFDFFLPTTTSQEPLWKLLGTRDEDKRRRLDDAAHNIPRNEMMKEVVDWMDKYWGPPVPLR